VSENPIIYYGVLALYGLVLILKSIIDFFVFKVHQGPKRLGNLDSAVEGLQKNEISCLRKEIQTLTTEFSEWKGRLDERTKETQSDVKALFERLNKLTNQRGGRD
jgi:uncharacterized protein YlxW (UPF0749 family)